MQSGGAQNNRRAGGVERKDAVGQPGRRLSALRAANCHCAKGEKHGPVFYLTRNEGGRTRNIYVPPELYDEVAAGVSAYRRYRELGQQLAEANARRLGLGKQRRRRRGDRTAASATESVRSSHRVG